MEPFKPLFEFYFFSLLYINVFKSHSDSFFSLRFKIEESVWILHLGQKISNISIIINILLELFPPLSNLLIIHDEFTKEIVEIDSYLSSLLSSSGITEIKPILFNLTRHIIHKIFQFRQGNLSLDVTCIWVRSINYLYSNYVINITIKSKSTIKYRIFISLFFCCSNIYSILHLALICSFVLV